MKISYVYPGFQSKPWAEIRQRFQRYLDAILPFARVTV
jgi:hypothetical protein